MEKYNLTRYEKETIIIFNEEETTARAETFNGRLLRQLEKAANACNDVICEEKHDDYGVYTLPKKLIKIHTPLKLSDEAREKMAERARALSDKRKHTAKIKSDPN